MLTANLARLKLISILTLCFLLSCGQRQNKLVSESVEPADTLKERQFKTDMFDPTRLSESDKEVLEDFYNRRKLFDKYIKDNKLTLFSCPSCGYPTLTERGNYLICDICDWEDDNQDDKEADEVWGGPNGNLSLTESRIKLGYILIHNADSVKAKINLDPDYVLQAIKFYKNKKREITSKITGQETLDDPIVAEWKQAKRDLQIALCRDRL